MNSQGMFDKVNGCVRYTDYQAKEAITISLDNPVVIAAAGVPKVQFKLLQGEVVFNHWDELAQDFEQVNHTLTGDVSGGQLSQDFIQVVSTAALTLNQDLQGFQVDQQHGTSMSLIDQSVIRLQQGTYQVVISASVDFTNANGHLHFSVLKHATHQSILTPALRSTLEISPGTNADDIGAGSNSFIMRADSTTDICVRPTVITNLQQPLYVNVLITRLL